MKRKRPLKRSPMPPRKSWIKRQSESKRKEKRDTDGPRRDYRLLFKTCQCCEVADASATHEMASGGSRRQAVHYREAWLSVCDSCHKKIHETMEWPLSRQMFQKQRGDPEYYNRRLVLKLKGWDEEAVSQEEVDAWQPTR